MTIKEELSDLEAKVSKGLKIAHKKMIAFKKYKKHLLLFHIMEKLLKCNQRIWQLENSRFKC